MKAVPCSSVARCLFVVLITTALCLTHLLSAMGVDPLPKVRIGADGRGFEADGKVFTPLGVTYYRPGTGWAPQVWKQFDAESTRADFARRKEVGINCVRVFISYGSFLTEPGALREDGLAKFNQFLEIAEAAGIFPTFRLDQ